MKLYGKRLKELRCTAVTHRLTHHKDNNSGNRYTKISYHHCDKSPATLLIDDKSRILGYAVCEKHETVLSSIDHVTKPPKIISIERENKMDIRYPNTEELEQMETIEEGWTDDLKFTAFYGPFNYKVWLARVGEDDGAPFDNMVTIEKFQDGRLVGDTFYCGDDPEHEAVPNIHKFCPPEALWADWEHVR